MNSGGILLSRGPEGVIYRRHRAVGEYLVDGNTQLEQHRREELMPVAFAIIALGAHHARFRFEW
jgi:hypothetical protein